VLTNDMSGLFHSGGPQRLSLYQIAQIVSRVGGYDPDLLMGCYRWEAGPMPPRAGNVTLDSRKLAEALGREPFDRWPWHDEHLPIDRQWHHHPSEPGSAQLLAETLYRNPQVRRLPSTQRL
jgi:dTDP-4-dehydrorhamnose reductase